MTASELGGSFANRGWQQHGHGGALTIFAVVSSRAGGRPSASGFDPAAPARSYRVGSGTTRSKPLAAGVSGVFSLSIFRLARRCSLSIGGWQPSGAAAPAIYF